MLCFLGLHNTIWKNVKYIGVMHTKFRIVVTSGWKGGEMQDGRGTWEDSTLLLGFLGWTAHT